MLYRGRNAFGLYSDYLPMSAASEVDQSTSASEHSEGEPERLVLEVRVVEGGDFLALAEAHDRAQAAEGGPDCSLSIEVGPD